MTIRCGWDWTGRNGVLSWLANKLSRSRMLMNPGPATFTLAAKSSRSAACTTCWANSRGFRRSRLAAAIAPLD